jgi:hypothetical protein
MARHAPLSRHPDALSLIRHAAGWRTSANAAPVVGRQPGRGGLVHGRDAREQIRARQQARRWVNAAREHAAELGPPPDLAAADPRILHDLARWCGAPLPIEIVPITRRRGRPITVVLRRTSDLVAARDHARQLLRAPGILATPRMIDQLQVHGVHLELTPPAATRDVDPPAQEEIGLRHLLGLAGTDDWLWPPLPAARRDDAALRPRRRRRNPPAALDHPAQGAMQLAVGLTDGASGFRHPRLTGHTTGPRRLSTGLLRIIRSRSGADCFPAALWPGTPATRRASTDYSPVRGEFQRWPAG